MNTKAPAGNGDCQPGAAGTSKTYSYDDADLAAIRTHTAQGDTTVLQLQNLHGDIIATASIDPNAIALTARFESDEFGNPREQTGRRFGWLGGKQRRAVLPSGVIQMGVRSYVPAVGRFTSVDPIADGSASSYDYAGADPVNNLDLDGRLCYKPHWRFLQATFYLCRGETKKLKRKMDEDGYKGDAAAGIFCSVLGAVLTPYAGVACATIYTIIQGSVRKNLKKAVKNKKCFTVAIMSALWKSHAGPPITRTTVEIREVAHVAGSGHLDKDRSLCCRLLFGQFVSRLPG